MQNHIKIFHPEFLFSFCHIIVRVSLSFFVVVRSTKCTLSIWGGTLPTSCIATVFFFWHIKFSVMNLSIMFFLRSFCIFCVAGNDDKIIFFIILPFAVAHHAHSTYDLQFLVPGCTFWNWMTFHLLDHRILESNFLV